MDSMTLYRWNLTVVSRRRQFDPKKQADLDEFAFFQKNHRWRDSCPFYLEWPFLDVIAMCKDKVVNNLLQ